VVFQFHFYGVRKLEVFPYKFLHGYKSPAIASITAIMHSTIEIPENI
jgi:hypothetical protein